MLIRRSERQGRRGMLAGALQGVPDRGLDRRSFLRRSGLVFIARLLIGAATGSPAR